MIDVETVVDSSLRVVCPRDELTQRLAVVARAVSTRSSVQILAGVMLQAKDGEVALAATDMEVSLRTSFAAQCEGEGAVVVPGRLLVELSRLLPEDEVVIEHRAEESVVRLTCGTASYQLNTYNPEDFPRLPDAAGAELHSVDRALLLETAARVSRSASRDESRPVLTGVLVRLEPGRLVMAATDSYRLAVRETPLAGELPELEAIVPARALAELARIAQTGDTVELALHDNHVLFSADGVWLTTRRIDGQFPNHKQLIPETFEYDLRISRTELLDVVRRTAVLAQRNSPLRLRFAEGELTVSAQTQDVGEATETMPIGFDGEPIEIGFNADFLRDGLESVEDEEIQLRLISSLRPGLIQSAAGDFSYLIMPIRLAG
jgi:DNA polymerase III subunit beta